MSDVQKLDRARKRLIEIQNHFAVAIEELRDQPGYRSEWQRLVNMSGEISAVRAQMLATHTRFQKRTEASNV